MASAWPPQAHTPIWTKAEHQQPQLEVARELQVLLGRPVAANLLALARSIQAPSPSHVALLRDDAPSPDTSLAGQGPEAPLAVETEQISLMDRKCGRLAMLSPQLRRCHHSADSARCCSATLAATPCAMRVQSAAQQVGSSCTCSSAAAGRAFPAAACPRSTSLRPLQWKEQSCDSARHLRRKTSPHESPQPASPPSSRRHGFGKRGSRRLDGPGPFGRPPRR
mmetsp:Transcript_43714/g.103217  ORF Transcript_43714/g.103217 Transcript_43714/m.103217 type:complete len:223 (-) Transcript_43714:195-863(-)